MGSINNPRTSIGSRNNLRVIAGQYKGTKLDSPRVTGTHPMGAREKNALFNLLQPWLKGAKVLDVYAGTGALGIEALSRGAACAVFIERDPQVAQVLRKNLARLSEVQSTQTGNRPDSARVIVTSVAQAAQRPDWQGKFDLVIADPPYDDFRPTTLELQDGQNSNNPHIQDILELCNNALAPNGVLALSAPSSHGELSLEGFTCLTWRRYAGAGIGIYQKI